MKKLLLFTSLFIISLTSFTQIQIGSDITISASEGQFGISVSLSSDGNILAVGSPYTDVNEENTGSVRIYKNNNGFWEQIGSEINGIYIPFVINIRFGSSVSLSANGNILAVGSGNKFSAYSYAAIYKNNNGVWEQIGDNIEQEAQFDGFGKSVSLSSDGNIVAIGGPGNNGNGSFNNSGHLKIYINNNGVWEQIGSDIDGEDSNEQLGSSLSLSSDGNILAVNKSGTVRIYKNDNDVWEQVGSDILGGGNLSLSSNGSIVAIATSTVRIYKNNNDIWEQIGNNIDADTFSSVSLSSDGTIVAVGYPEINTNDNGYVRIYEINNDVWEQRGVDIIGETFFEGFGSSVSLSSNGNILSTGTPYSNNGGYVEVYDLSAVLSSDSFTSSKFNIYPNPTKNSFTIDLKDNLEYKKVNIYNSLGQFIKSNKELTINTTNLSTGIYFVQIETNQGKATKKLVIE